jgi:hypothetical protein
VLVVHGGIGGVGSLAEIDEIEKPLSDPTSHPVAQHLIWSDPAQVSCHRAAADASCAIACSVVRLLAQLCDCLQDDSTGLKFNRSRQISYLFGADVVLIPSAAC